MEEFIELNAFIKKLGLVSTGGQAKNLIRSGAVKLNGIIETRNRKKLYTKDTIEIESKIYIVEV